MNLHGSWANHVLMLGLSKEANSCFVVTWLDEMDVQKVYGKRYCARGDMDNRIKGQQAIWPQA
jgi:hypothetical protein